VIIKATYDQTITKAIRNDKGEVIAYEPTTHHYTFGNVGSAVSGGFYIKVDQMGEVFGLSTEHKGITAIVPALEISIFLRDNIVMADKRKSAAD